ncbi:MAG: protein TolQ [Alphaproteobacteria bacterium]|nr:MAG: protein TolQ [Alphaproteobacteria bacterium]
MNEDDIIAPLVDSTQLEGSFGDMSIWSLLIEADPVVQIVLLILVAASLWCWTIIFNKIGLYRRVVAKTDGFEDEFWSGQSLDELYKRMKDNADHPMAALFVAAMTEWRRSVDSSIRGGFGARLHERIDQIMRVTLNREINQLERYLGFLATVGSTAPFIGLFGTVWGIMGSFQSIAASSDTSLAVVAPGIAEALFATAMGLLAAIPAVVAYNKFSGDMAQLAMRLEGFVQEFNTILSRQMEEGQR